MTLVPFEELAFSPHKEPCDRLCAIIGKRAFVASRDSWPPWQRLQSIHGWKRLNLAAERCEPGKRFPGNIELVCIQIAKDEQEAAMPAPPKPPKLTEADRQRRMEDAARCFDAVRGRTLEQAPDAVRMPPTKGTEQ